MFCLSRPLDPQNLQKQERIFHFNFSLVITGARGLARTSRITELVEFKFFSRVALIARGTPALPVNATLLRAGRPRSQ